MERMTKKGIILGFALLAMAASCKKDNGNSDDSGQYLLGNLYVSVPEYVEYGKYVKMVPYGVYHPLVNYRSDGSIPDSLSYLYVNPFTKDTVRTKTVPPDPVSKDPSDSMLVSVDTVGLFSVLWTARATGYYSRSYTARFNIVDKEKSLSGFVEYPSDGSLTTAEHTYRTAVIAGREWMRSNLCDSLVGGVSWKGCDVVDVMFGRYYTRTEAVSACPEGWRLPTAAEWDAVCDAGNVKDALYDVKFNGEAMWEYYPKVGDPTDSLHLSVIPAGYVMLSGKSHVFRGLSERAVFWTSDLKTGDSGMGVAKYFVDSSPNMQESYFAVDEVRLSVRCVKK